jgi:hypothetical protein
MNCKICGNQTNDYDGLCSQLCLNEYIILGLEEEE